MISKARIKYINSLKIKKIRDEEKFFVIEGDKLVMDFLESGMHIKMLVAKPDFINSIPADLLISVTETAAVSDDELRQMSSFKTPHNALALVRMPELTWDNLKILKEYCVVLDCIQDPGNLGTIIRAAAWFGINNIVCSPDCVDVYNPKVIQASMGALLHVKVFYHDLGNFLSEARKLSLPVYGTLMEGLSIYDHKPWGKGVILFGNESKGISGGLIQYITDRITIPKFSTALKGIDSLNVGMAASIVFSEFQRKSGRVKDL